MSLSKLSASPFRYVVLRENVFSPQRVLIVRLSHTSPAAPFHGNLPPPPTKEVPDPGRFGFLKYQRNWSRDKKYNLDEAPQKGNTPATYLVRRLDHAYELYPLVFLFVFLNVVMAWEIYWSVNKGEVWVDKSEGKEKPGDWSRIRDNYWKKPTLAYDPEGITHRRLELMETLEDEMLDAAKKRGTR